MIPRRTSQILETALHRQAAVALIGARQVGKTTLALDIAERTQGLYLDLESRADRQRLAEPALFLAEHSDRLVVLDEIHRAPGLFPELRGIIDRGRRAGRRTGRFLILGSASMDLLRQSGESLAGRIELVPLHALDVLEVEPDTASANTHWVRGGFPDSLLAASAEDSAAFRRNLIRTYLDRDISEFTGRRVPAETLERLWTMLAHGQGTLLNAAKLAASLGISSPTVTGYIDLLVDLLLVRRLRPYHANVKKRLVKSPKTYVRDSGITHALLGIEDYTALAGHPVAGASWEGFVIENLLAAAPLGTVASFYRTQANAEIDLLLELPGQAAPWAVEIKLGLAPSLGRGFHNARQDIRPAKSFVVYSGTERYPLATDVEAIGLTDLARLLASH
ncbi:MAG: ATP-binding protein [Gammaproteobacteria bacterium]|nr:ATP-binding protein [Gammaproteobacteria bacterium]MXY06539.1 ATP-binding protein [Gammaproteobacteria bacterium]MYE53340.1 ATP-binding protein [Gammaproteobacteria bacterium]MYG11969.1 ATP-binding protein [Gammaproteobacteria bacterium]MYK28128.1 ATP-binding protein [Gammaproteobacteria bacterium]